MNQWLFKQLVLLLTPLALLLPALPAYADTIYIVQPGDTVYRIALKFGLSQQAIIEANGLTNPSRIFVGQRLAIPGAPSGSTSGSGASSGGTYTVQRGDTLFRIALKFNTTVAALKTANRLTSNFISVGQVLVVPGKPFTGTPSISTFTSDKVQATLGEAVTFSWQATGAKAMLCLDTQLSRVPCSDIPLSGSQRVNLTNALRALNTMQFQLMIYPTIETTSTPVTASLTVTVTCPNKWFFTNAPNECASLAANRWAVMERFEQGLMVWFQDSGETYVLAGDGTSSKPYSEVRDTSGKTYPDSDPAIKPPAGRYQPVRGFGKFWRGAVPGHEWVRQQLGWATEPEGGYSSFYQCNAALGEAGRCYLGTPRGEIIVFTKGSGLFWSFLKGSTIANVPPPKLPGEFLCAPSTKDFVIFKADGSGMFPRTTNFVGFSGFSFSPDGKQVVFSANTTPNDDAELYLASADGTGGLKQLTDNKFWDVQPAWSPDGKRIVFVSIRDSQSGLYLMNADGSGQTLIPNTKAEDARPTWSPDGLKLAFHSVQANSTTTPAIFIINADGAGRTQLTFGYDLNPVWSPDGKSLVFESHRDANTGGSSYEIYVRTLEGKETRLTVNTQADYRPVWSPDSQWVAYSSTDNGGAVYALKADGSGQVWRMFELPSCDEKAWGP